MHIDPKREAAIRGKAQWFAKCIRISNIPCEIPHEVLAFLNDPFEERRFERYLVHFGLYKRSDDKWAIKLT
jgi:hypothetical protein